MENKKELNNQAMEVYRLLKRTEDIMNNTEDENFKARMNEIKEEIKALLDELDEKVDSL